MTAPNFQKTSGLLSILALICLALLQGFYDLSTTDRKKADRQFALEQSQPLIPSPQILHFLSLGDQPLVADFLWLDTIQYFGTSNPYAKFAALPRLLDTITQVDPKFAYPYQFGLIVLPFMGAADTAQILGERAQQEIPNDALLTFYLATVYQINLKDYKKAAEYYTKSASIPGAPGAAKELAGVSLAKVNEELNDRLVALAFWKTVYENAANEDEKERALNWYNHMNLVYNLETLIQNYKNTHGAFPTALDELVKANIISEIPLSPIERQLDYDPIAGKISFDRLRGN